MATRRAKGEGSIRQRADGRYEARVYLPDGTRRSAYGKTPTEAARKKAALLAEVNGGITPVSDRVTVGEYLEQWAKGLHSGHIKHTTAGNYERIVRMLLRQPLSRYRLTALNAGHIERMLGELIRKGYTPTYANLARTILRIALNQAIRNRILSHNAAQFARPLPVLRKQRAALRRDEAVAILQAVSDWYYAPTVFLALSTGMRRGEICGLRWGDIDMDGGLLQVRQQIQRVNGRLVVDTLKSESSRRTIPVHPLVLNMLQQWRPTAIPSPKSGPYADLIFTSLRHPGTPVDPGGIVRGFQDRIARAGLPHLRFHDLRHAAISFWHALGVDPKTAADLAGHANVAMTLDVYTHVAPEIQRAAVLKLGDHLFAGMLPARGPEGVSIAATVCDASEEAAESKLRSDITA